MTTKKPLDITNLLTPADVAKLGVTVAAQSLLRGRGRLAFICIGRRGTRGSIRYRREDIDRLIAERTTIVEHRPTPKRGARR